MSQKQQWTIVATLIAVPVIFGLLTRPVDNALQSEQPSVQITVADGATLSEVADSLFARGVINSRFFFEVYVRAQREDRRIKAGRYQMNVGRSWASTIRQLTRGEVMTEIVTIPEGFRLNQIAPRIARLSRESIADVTSLLASPGLGEQLADTYGGQCRPISFPTPIALPRACQLSEFLALWLSDIMLRGHPNDERNFRIWA